MPDLAVIIPQVNEWPQVAFTVADVYEELRDRCDVEVIVVDNWCDEAASQGRQPDRSLEYLVDMAKRLPWLKVLRYQIKLSHWQAKNLAVRSTDAPFLFFEDAHCILARDGLFNLYKYYRKAWTDLDGPIHLPWTYHLLESRLLAYKLVNNLDMGFIGYSLSQGAYHRFVATESLGPGKPFRVPCMSTNGMLVHRSFYDMLGGWPEALGIWGGGENFFNFCLATMGRKSWMMPGLPLRHHGDRRGYNYLYRDLVRNRAIAMFMIGGRSLCRRFCIHVDEDKTAPPDRSGMIAIGEEVVATCRPHRDLIKARQTMTIEDWAGRWPRV
ncbi:MAG: glycosyltransferase family 2 protein [Proteobacteria bacterium]|nr:glycosyltransferase family 2 protein [Pseudomonadota bacterium]